MVDTWDDGVHSKCVCVCVCVCVCALHVNLPFLPPFLSCLPAPPPPDIDPLSG